MGIIKPIVESHEKLIKGVRDFLEGKSDKLPDLGGGRFERQAYKYALVIDTLTEKVDSIFEEAKSKAEEKGNPVTCSAGCSECCSQPVGINLPEVFLIAEYLNQNPEAKARFFEKYPAWRKSIDPAEYDNRMQEMLAVGPSAEGVTEAVMYFYKQGAVPCPLLENDLCDIYPARPITCRQQMTTSDPQDCRDGKQVKKLISGDFDTFMLEKASPTLVHILENVGIHRTQVMGIFPILTKQYLENGKAYIDMYAQKASGMR